MFEAEYPDFFQNPIDVRWISVPCTLALIVIMLTKGANIGVSMLWLICGILAVSLTTFFMGRPDEFIMINEETVRFRPESLNLTEGIPDGDTFGKVFAICFSRIHGDDCRIRVIR